MAEGVAFIEVRTEQGELVHRFTITLADAEREAESPGAVMALIEPWVKALPVTDIARQVADAVRR